MTEKPRIVVVKPNLAYAVIIGVLSSLSTNLFLKFYKKSKSTLNGKF